MNSEQKEILLIRIVFVAWILVFCAVFRAGDGWAFLFAVASVGAILSIVNVANKPENKKTVLICWIIAVGLIFSVYAGIKINYRSVRNHIISERDTYSDTVRPKIDEYLYSRDYVESADVQKDFSLHKGKTEQKDDGAHTFYTYLDYFDVYMHVTEGFEELSDKEKLSYGNEIRESVEGKLTDAYRNTSYYYKYVDLRDMPWTNDYYMQDIMVTLYILCDDNTYKYDYFSSYYSYEINGLKIYPNAKPKKPVDYSEQNNTNSGGSGGYHPPSSSGGKKHIFHDPDDYDDPDDYADDAWGSDFDSYDKAYDYWDDW